MIVIIYVNVDTFHGWVTC